MPEPNFSAFSFAFKLIGAAPKLYAKVQTWRGSPSKEDRARLIAYCRRLDERRVFSAPFDDEVEDVCVASLNQVKEFTDEALADIEHPAARAAVGAILDEVRKFLDKWHGYRGPRSFGLHPRHPWRDQDVRSPDFFQDLGELRGKMKLLVGMLTEMVPAAKAPC